MAGLDSKDSQDELSDNDSNTSVKLHGIVATPCMLHPCWNQQHHVPLTVSNTLLEGYTIQIYATTSDIKSEMQQINSRVHRFKISDRLY